MNCIYNTKSNLRIGIGDSRNPEEIESGIPMMHTNCIRTWLRYNGVWYQCVHNGVLRHTKFFEDCKTEEDYDWVFNCLLEDNELYTN